MDKKILIVDDEERIRFVLTRTLKNAGYETFEAESGEEALKKIVTHEPDIVILDLELPGINGLETLDRIQDIDNQIPVLILTAYGSIANAVDAMQRGALNYLTKPYDNRELLITIDRAFQQISMKQELYSARERLENERSLEGIITINSKILQLFEVVKRTAPTDASVLITGESGTGKELFANAVHQNSNRKNRPFVVLNCGAIPENLIESELFGHERGAFSGASVKKPGLVEKADQGTLFLDEIGEMSMGAQVKLLRFLQSGEFLRVGSVQQRKVDVRIVAATNSDLEQAIANKTFREDLYYRLNVIKLEIPPLRDRMNDIPVLAHHFLQKAIAKNNVPGKKLDNSIFESLYNYHWPGNVRELENVIHSALVTSGSTVLDSTSLPSLDKQYLSEKEEQNETGTLLEIVKRHTDKLEKKLIMKALAACSGNQTKTAESLGIGRRTLIRKMNQYNL